MEQLDFLSESKGNGMSLYMTQELSNKVCKNCCHYAEYENICIRYSPHMIVETNEFDNCDDWEERREPLWVRRQR